jgi:hypothetical protein
MKLSPRWAEGAPLLPMVTVLFESAGYVGICQNNLANHLLQFTKLHNLDVNAEVAEDASYKIRGFMNQLSNHHMKHKHDEKCAIPRSHVPKYLLLYKKLCPHLHEDNSGDEVECLGSPPKQDVPCITLEPFDISDDEHDIGTGVDEYDIGTGDDDVLVSTNPRLQALLDVHDDVRRRIPRKTGSPVEANDALTGDAISELASGEKPVVTKKGLDGAASRVKGCRCR